MTKILAILNNHIEKIEEVKNVLFNKYESVEIESQDIIITNTFLNEMLADCENFKEDTQLLLLVEQSGSIDKFNSIFDIIILKDKMYQDFKEVKLYDNSKDSQKMYEYTCDNIFDSYYESLKSDNERDLFDEMEFINF